MSRRLVVLDTETTGLEPSDGHRIIEIGCVELVNRRLTGNNQVPARMAVVGVIDEVKAKP